MLVSKVGISKKTINHQPIEGLVRDERGIDLGGQGCPTNRLVWSGCIANTEEGGSWCNLNLLLSKSNVAGGRKARVRRELGFPSRERRAAAASGILRAAKQNGRGTHQANAAFSPQFTGNMASAARSRGEKQPRGGSPIPHPCWEGGAAWAMAHG